jgi:ABC-2 type transport system permease protein
MLELARYVGRRRTRAAIAVTGAFSGFALFYIALFPTFTEGLDGEIDKLLEAYPEAVSKAFGVQTLSSMEGYLASELYTFGWLLLVGLYFGYIGASLVADDVERNRIDIFLALPVSRARLVVEKFLSVLVALAGLTVVVPLVVYAGTVAVGHPIPATDLIVLHLLSVPYFLVCAGVGLVASVRFDRVSVAQRVALGVLAGLFFAESLLADTDFEIAGILGPSRYLDPNAVLLDSEYAVLDAVILFAGAVGLLALAVWLFQRKDVE